MNYAIATYLNYKIYNYALNPANGLTGNDVSEEIIKIKKESLYALGVYTVTTVLAFFTPFAPAGYALFAFQHRVVNPKKK